jgi:hypothetical protein
MNTHRLRLVVATTLLTTTAGCAGVNLGSIGNVLGGVLGSVAGVGEQPGQLVVEVQGVDARRQLIHVRTQHGETGAVMYDQNTVVVYQRQQYPVTALEPGDIAGMQVQEIDRNRLYTSRIDVQQSVRDRTDMSRTPRNLQMWAP